MQGSQGTVYEINTWVWLTSLTEQHGFPVNLGSVPAAEWDAIAACGFDAVWLMGVWERSPAGIAIAHGNPALLAEFRRTLPDFQPSDNVGSAYCVRRYVVDAHLGGPAALAIARNELARRGMKLLLDFVANHAAPDCPSILTHPDHFMQGSTEDLRANPSGFLQIGSGIFARGKDPYFAPWADVIQVNAFSAGFRQSSIAVVHSIAEQCDGIRCDMAMLLVNSVFARTWGSRGGPIPATEYWPMLIAAVKAKHAQFLFIAEAYWDMEYALQQQGFDFCYDKRLYDRLIAGNAPGVRLHLGAELAYQRKLIRFIENHDEPRAAVAFSPAAERTAAVTMATIPGARLFHEGQFSGRKVRVATFLGRRPEESADPVTEAFYRRLLLVIGKPVFRMGAWVLCSVSGWPDNQSCENLVAWCWSTDAERCLILVNLSAGAAQARIHLPWTDLGGGVWRLADALSDASYDRAGDEMEQQGLYVGLQPWEAQILAVRSAK
jgi:hypothetical protein